MEPKDNNEFIPYGTNPAIDSLIDNLTIDALFNENIQKEALDIIDIKDLIDFQCHEVDDGFELFEYHADTKEPYRKEELEEWFMICLIDARYGWDKLINHKDGVVRNELAQCGYRLDILINDPEKYVRDTANYILQNPSHSLLNILDKIDAGEDVDSDILTELGIIYSCEDITGPRKEELGRQYFKDHLFNPTPM